MVVIHRRAAEYVEGLSLSPLAVTEKKRVILDLSYGRGGLDGASSVNGDTDFTRAPVCEL